jgi:rare lipoprotein A
VLRLPAVMSMVAPLILVPGCAALPANPQMLHGPAPVPPMTVRGHLPGSLPLNQPSLSQPYTVNGRTFVPRDQPGYDTTGGAVVSHRPELGLFGPPGLTALHATLPVPSLVEITNLENECSIVVRITGRGATSFDRIVEISAAAAAMLRVKARADVRVRYQGAVHDGRDAAELDHIARYPGLGCAKPMH